MHGPSFCGHIPDFTLFVPIAVALEPLRPAILAARMGRPSSHLPARSCSLPSPGFSALTRPQPSGVVERQHHSITLLMHALESFGPLQ